MTGDLLSGDTAISKCKLTTKSNDSLILPAKFHDLVSKTNFPRTGFGDFPPTGLVDVDSSTLVNFIGNDTTAKISCGVYYQTWNVYAAINAFSYSRSTNVLFKNSPPTYRIDSIMGRREIVTNDNDGTRFILYTTKSRKTNKNMFYVTKSHYITIYGDDYRIAMIDSSSFTESGLLVDVGLDSIQIMIVPNYILPRKNEKAINAIDSLYSKCSQLNASWCTDERSMATVDSIISIILLPNGNSNPGNWIWGKKVEGIN